VQFLAPLSNNTTLQAIELDSFSKDLKIRVF